MKKLILLLSVVLLIAETCFGQNHLQPIRRYLSKKGEPKIFYSPRSMKNYTYENEKYRETLFSQTGESEVESMYQGFRVAKDTTLLAGTYLNSGLNPVTGEYESFPGKFYRGDVTVHENYENGYYKKILVYKDECANILNLPSRALRDVDLRYSPNTTSKRRIEFENPIQTGQDDWSFRTPGATSEERINLNLPTTEETYSSSKKNIGAGWFIVPGAILAGVITYLIIEDNSRKSSTVTTGHGVDPPPPDPGGVGVDPPSP